MRDSPAEHQDIQYVTTQQKLIKQEDMELLTDPEIGVVLVPNINVDDLQVIPEVEPWTRLLPWKGLKIQSSSKKWHKHVKCLEAVLTRMQTCLHVQFFQQAVPK
eukprot:1223941-Amphidinium_carterae.1